MPADRAALHKDFQAIDVQRFEIESFSLHPSLMVANAIQEVMLDQCNSCMKEGGERSTIDEIYFSAPPHFSSIVPRTSSDACCSDSLIFEVMFLASSPLPCISRTIAR